MNDGLTPESRQQIRAVLARHPEVEVAVLYGSRAIGTYRTGSDIDLTLKGHGLNTSALLKIENELDDLLLPYKIDLSIHDLIDNAELRAHIARVGIEFYRR